MGRGGGTAALFMGILGGAFIYGAVRAAKARAALLPGVDPWLALPLPSSSPEGLGRGREHVPDDDATGNPAGAQGGTVAMPSIDEWAVVLAPGCRAHGIQLPYALKWGSMESGGRPCAVGYPAAKGPDGYPKEMGLGQFYNPDDLTTLKLSSARLRAYCVPGDQHEVRYNGKTIRGFSQELARPLTAAEVKEQADALVGLMTRAMTTATRDLRNVGAGAGWSPSRTDYWALVKLQHGLPEVSSAGLALVTKHLGRPPVGWAEFKAGIQAVKFGPKTEAKYRARIPAILANAEECASAFSASAGAVS